MPAVMATTWQPLGHRPLDELRLEGEFGEYDADRQYHPASKATAGSVVAVDDDVDAEHVDERHHQRGDHTHVLARVAADHVVGLRTRTSDAARAAVNTTSVSPRVSSDR
jgi:hypothetical protein